MTGTWTNVAALNFVTPDTVTFGAKNGNAAADRTDSPQPYAPAVAGRLLERSKGKDTTTGHWELMGIVTPTPCSGECMKSRAAWWATRG